VSRGRARVLLRVLAAAAAEATEEILTASPPRFCCCLLLLFWVTGRPPVCFVVVVMLFSISIGGRLIVRKGIFVVVVVRVVDWIGLGAGNASGPGSCCSRRRVFPLLFFFMLSTSPPPPLRPPSYLSTAVLTLVAMVISSPQAPRTVTRMSFPSVMAALISSPISPSGTLRSSRVLPPSSIRER
jgi:hypothetical protein